MTGPLIPLFLLIAMAGIPAVLAARAGRPAGTLAMVGYAVGVGALVTAFSLILFELLQVVSM